MAKQVDSSNIGTLLQGVFTKVKNTFWRKDETSQLAIDNVPTSGSNNLVKSGGVYSAIPDVSQFITRSVNDLANYYLKTETYTKDEVAALIGAIQQFHYEIVASLPAVTNPQSNVLYLIGPTGSGSDKYEEYVYSNGWVKIGDTSIDLSGYVTTTALNTALAAYTTSADLATLLAGKQDTISDLATIRSGAAAGATAYQKPQGGIPASDLADKYAGSPSAGGPAFKALGIPYGAVDANSTATDIKATVDNFPETLVAGVCAYIRNDVVSSASGFTLNINGTGALPVYQSLADASRVTTLFSAASTFLFVYNPTRVEGGCWDLYYGYNSNDNTVGYNLRTNGGTAVAAAKFYRYRLLFTAPDGQSLVPSNTSSSTSSTAAKTVNQAKIDPFAPIWYYSTTTAINAGSSASASYLWLQYSAIPLGYAFNRTGAALTMTARYPVYLKCAPQSDGSAIMDADTPIVQALPSTEDGKIYIFLGYAESEVNITLYYWHPVYYFKDGSIRQWTNAAAGGSAAGAVRYDETQSLTDAQKAQARTNIGAKDSEVFWAEYGVTTVAEIKAQVDAGKSVMLLHSTVATWGVPLIYYLSIASAYSAMFESSFLFMRSRVFVDIQDNNSVWTEDGPVAFEMADYKVTSWQTTPDNDHYPSEKLVKDSLDGKQPTIDANHKLNYSLLSNTPTIPTVPTISTNIQTDKASDAKTASPKAVYDEVHPAVVSTQPQGGFLPNVEYQIAELISGNVTFSLASEVNGISNHYYWSFDTSSLAAPSITWPAGIIWNGGSAPTINADKHYEISVLNRRGVWMETDVQRGIVDGGGGDD